MRKDVILGMTIGGVMLAVVIVYLTISPNGKRNKHPVDTSGQLADGSGADPTGAGGTGGDGAGGVGSGGTVSGEIKHDGADGSATSPDLSNAKLQVVRPSAEDKRDPVWGRRLFPNSTPLLVTTQTPDPNAAGASASAAATEKAEQGGGGD